MNLSRRAFFGMAPTAAIATSMLHAEVSEGSDPLESFEAQLLERVRDGLAIAGPFPADRHLPEALTSGRIPKAEWRVRYEAEQRLARHESASDSLGSHDPSVPYLGLRQTTPTSELCVLALPSANASISFPLLTQSSPSPGCLATPSVARGECCVPAPRACFSSGGAA